LLASSEPAFGESPGMNVGMEIDSVNAVVPIPGAVIETVSTIRGSPSIGAEPVAIQFTEGPIATKKRENPPCSGSIFASGKESTVSAGAVFEVKDKVTKRERK
jgi:hypothetical protein